MRLSPFPLGAFIGLLAVSKGRTLIRSRPMPANAPTQLRFEDRLRASPVPAFRDVVAKEPTSGPNLAALDGVRGLAVAIVVAGHADGFRMLGHGAAGVWLFFVLSAFLLTLPYVERPERLFESGHLWRYTRRRLLRILPVYYFTITFLTLLVGAGAVYALEHFVFVRASGIFWTIPQEMLFYVFLPALVALHPLVCRRRIGATVLLLAAIAFLAHTQLTPDRFSLAGNSKRLPFHLGIFVTGMAFAYAIHLPSVIRFTKRPAVRRGLDALGIALLIGLIFSAPYFVRSLANAVPALGDLEFRMALRFKPAYGVLSGCLIAISVLCEGGMTQRILASVPLRALGVVSFSLYLFHGEVQGALTDNFHWLQLGTPLFACSLIASFSVACILYSLLERPFMLLGRSPPRTAE